MKFPWEKPKTQIDKSELPAWMTGIPAEDSAATEEKPSSPELPKMTSEQIERARILSQRFKDLNWRYRVLDSEITPLFNLSTSRIEWVLLELSEGEVKKLLHMPFMQPNKRHENSGYYLTDEDFEIEGKKDIAKSLDTFEKAITQMEQLVEQKLRQKQ